MSKPFIISVNEREIPFISEDKTILNTLEKANIESHYHCRDGFCGACRCKLASGTIEYINEPLAYVLEGEFLTCCAYPTSDIKIEIE